MWSIALKNRTFNAENRLKRRFSEKGGTNGDTELFKKSRNINSFRACRIANNLY